MTTTKDDRYYNWCFTSFKDCIGFKADQVQYITWQHEVCPTTQSKHIQGYVEFKKKLSLKQVKEYLQDKKCHVEVRRGSQKQAIDYCHKKDTKDPKYDDFFEYGTPKDQGHRTDIDDIYDDLEEGLTSKEILVRYRGRALKYINMIAKGVSIFHGFDLNDSRILSQRQEESMLRIRLEYMKQQEEDAKKLKQDEELRRLKEEKENSSNETRTASDSNNTSKINYDYEDYVE